MPGEWSVNEVLAHLVIGERDGHAWLEELVAGGRAHFSLADGNSHVRTQATAQVYGSQRTCWKSSNATKPKR